MARKSRRENSNPNPLPIPVIADCHDGERIPTALYARLSVEDGNKGNNDTINNQIAYVRNYIANHSEYELVDMYIDNGFSGTNFDRPEFNRMMADASHGKVSCIIVKDLSRFGRNYIETGMYLESILPKLGVRLIAINDNFDSFNENDRNSISVPMKNMINEMYARDHSRKSTLAHKLRRNNPSKLPGGIAPYGYLIDEENNKYIFDPEKSDYVKMVFLWRSLGNSCGQICLKLDLIGAPFPLPGSKRSDNPKWNTSTVERIVSNRAYRGDLCFGKTSHRISSNGHAVKYIPENEWTIRENQHDPLVTSYELEAIETNKTTYSKGVFVDHLGCFKGILFCKECGRSMSAMDISFYRKFSSKEKTTVYRFGCYSRPKGFGFCGNGISEDALKVIVMENIKLHLKLMTDKAETIKSFMSSDAYKDIPLSIDKKIMAAEVSLSEEKERQAKLYEDYRTGFLEREDFELINENTSARIVSLEDNLAILKKKKDDYLRTINSYLGMIDEIKPDPDEEGFDPELVRKLVEKVEVTKDKRVEITFKFADICSLIDEAMKGVVS